MTFVRGAARVAVTIACLVAALLTAALGGAQPVPTPPLAAEPDPAAALQVSVHPVLSDAGIYEGLVELVARFDNRGPRSIRGEIVALAPVNYGQEAGTEVRAPFAVGAESSVTVALPVRVLGQHVKIVVEPEGAPRREIPIQAIASADCVSLLDASPGSRLRAALQDTPVNTLFAPTGVSRGGPRTLRISTALIDPATGDPILPQWAAGYAGADVVVMRSDVLARLSAAQQESLAGFVLAGGTLAIVIARPEDLHDPTIVKLVGGPLEKGEAHPDALVDITLPPIGPEQNNQRPLPEAFAPTAAVAAELAGYFGGNLAPSHFGATAAYGLGEVVILAFDPNAPTAIEDPWVLERMIDLVRRGFDRRSTVVFRPGSEMSSFRMFGGDELEEVRRALDPNENTRWAVAVAALLLCLYAVLAGPLNFSLASKRGRPLSALRHLPLYALGGFVLVVLIGVSAHGLDGRSRRLSLVEAGGGAKVGTIRRFRGLYTSRSQDLSVSAFDRTSTLTTVPADRDRQFDHLSVDREGLRLGKIGALPWQTVVVREDGFTGLGGGVSIVEQGTDVMIVNQTGRSLRSALLRLPLGDVYYFAAIAGGDRVTTSSGRKLGVGTQERAWLGESAVTSRIGMIDAHPLAGSSLIPILESDAPGLGEAWSAIEQAAGDSVDWFPPGVPVLLAQIDGGEGRSTDAGLAVESDRLLLRVVGFGGEP